MHRHAENGGIVQRRYSSAHDQDGDGLSRGKIAFFPINLSYLWLGITREKKKKKENTTIIFNLKRKHRKTLSDKRISEPK